MMNQQGMNQTNMMGGQQGMNQPMNQQPNMAGGQVQGGQQVVLAPPGTSNLVTSQHPASSQLVVVQPTSQPAPQVVQLVTSSGQPLTATPAPFLSAPTPQPIVVSQTVPLQSSSTNPQNPQNYTFDPAGLTPAQQLAYAQAQQQHQQQHLKKMRQRLPHGGKTGGSPHVGRKFEGPHIGQNHMPTAALLHEAKLGEALLSTLLLPICINHLKTDQNKH